MTYVLTVILVTGFYQQTMTDYIECSTIAIAEVNNGAIKAYCRGVSK